MKLMVYRNHDVMTVSPLYLWPKNEQEKGPWRYCAYGVWQYGPGSVGFCGGGDRLSRKMFKAYEMIAEHTLYICGPVWEILFPRLPLRENEWMVVDAKLTEITP